MTQKEKILLIFIVLLAFVLRFYQLGQNPPSLTWDEAAIGYNAYSILKTGKDEHGRFLPIDYFASFGDYKPPVAVYASVLSTAIFGLNEFSTRLPSALFGTLTVLATYFLVKEIFPRKNFQFSIFNFQLITSFLLAISPWHILSSRAAFEANIASFFIVLGTYFLVKAIKEKGQHLLLSVLCYLSAVYTFNTPRLFLPLFLLGLALIYRKELLKIKKWVIIGGCFGLIMIAPLVPHLLSEEGKLRFEEVNIFTNLEVIKTANQRIEAEKNSLLARIIHNRRIGYGLLFLKHYLDHFNPGYLFFHGDVNPKFSIQDTGQLYLIEAPFLVLGLYYLFRSEGKTAWLIILWLLAGLVPAGMARETPHALRTLVTLPTWQIIIAWGIIGFYQSFRSKKFKKALSLFLVTCYILHVTLFLHNYFVHYPKEFSREWQYGYKEAVLAVAQKYGDYDKVLVSDVYGRPYIYFLYYLQYPPLKYQQEGIRERNVFGQYQVKGFDKFRFGDLSQLISEEDNKKVLFVGRGEEIPQESKTLKEIKFLNGEIAFVIAEK